MSRWSGIRSGTNRGFRFFLIIFISVIITVVMVDTNELFDIVIERCQKNCPQQLILQDQELDIACNFTCKINLCQTGCRYWNVPLSECFRSCHSGGIDDDDDDYSLGDQDKYCAVGCNHAHTVYVDQLKTSMGTALAPPRLIPASLANDSLAIEWNPIPDFLRGNLSHQIQWRYHRNDRRTEWIPVATENSVSITTNSVHITGLHAYTGYQFRLQWSILTTGYDSVAIYSAPSVPITTLPYGTPATACQIISAMAISFKQISVNWRGPEFPNGPIIAYSLYLINNKTGHRTVKDIHTLHTAGSPEVIHNYVFNDLESDSNYTLSIVTHNNFGEGPPCSRQVVTPAEPEISHSESDGNDNDEDGGEHYQLYLASTKSVARRNAEMLLDEEIVYHLGDYVDNGEITGMAVHVERRYLFVSDSSGTIRRVTLMKKSSINQVIKIVTGSNQPSHLNVDWLHHRLYWLEDQNRVVRSALDGTDIHPFYIPSFHNQKPLDFKVDPYNGYLFWIQPNIFNRTALYRLDLEDLGSPITDHNNQRSKIQLIYQSDSWISAFAINFLEYRLIFPMSHTGTIHSITIDGMDETTIRDRSMSMENIELFVNIENLAIFNQRLYFTRGENISWEEYHREEQMYYHNTYTTESRLVSLAVMDQQSQPYPVPLTPVENVQAIFLDTTAKISWSKPTPFGATGRGAWQNWRYEIAIKEISGTIEFAEVNSVTECDVAELRPDTEYEIRVRPFTRSGKGTWSETFRGRTLPSLDSLSHRPYAVVATRDGNLITTDLDGKFRQQLMAKSRGIETSDMASITAIEPYRDLLILLRSGTVVTYNQSSFTIRTVSNISHVHAIALEPLAPKLYWSNPLERMICRCNLDGTQMEILPIITFAQELAIDSGRGFLYWATPTAIKLARLNGAKNSQRLIYRTTDSIRSGATIKSLTVNDEKLYWITVDTTTAPILNQLPLLDDMTNIPQPEQVVLGRPLDVIGPRASFANRFWWLDVAVNRILISDHRAQTFATVKVVSSGSSTGADVTGFAVILDHHQQNDRIVVPLPVVPETVQIVGTWENFTIRWQPVTNVNYGKVFYDLSLEQGSTVARENRTNFILSGTEFVLPDHLKPLRPYAKIRVALRSFTYWASARQIVADLHTPSSIPSKPIGVRVYTEPMTTDDQADDHLLSTIVIDPIGKRRAGSGQFVAEARWEEPEQPNGPIQSYTVSLWTVDQDRVVSIVNTVVIGRRHQFRGLTANSTYYFEVRAATDVGEGPPSDVVQFKTHRARPPMRLLLAETDSIMEADVDLLDVRPLVKSLSPVLLDYHHLEDRLYFVEEGNFLKQSHLRRFGGGSNYSLIWHFDETVTSITMDWIGRRLYLATVDVFHNRSTIWWYHPESSGGQPHPVIKLEGRRIHTLRSDPFRSRLIWTEFLIGAVHLPARVRQCRLTINGTACQQVAGYFRSPTRQRLCNCTHAPAISGSFLLLREAGATEPAEMIYFDRNERTFVRCQDGCYCRRITSYVETGGTVPLAIELDRDSGELYWKNQTIDGLVYHTELDSKPDDHFRQKLSVFDLKKSIRAMIRLPTASTQPYPSIECLVPPENFSLRMSLLEHTSTTLTVRIDLDEDEYRGCQNTLPTLRYRIRISDNRSLETYNQTVIITNLEPFTNYTVTVWADNHYSDLRRNLVRREQQRAKNASLVPVTIDDDSDEQPYGKFVFQTAESRPDPPRNVRAVVEAPDRILILWDPPERLNAEQVSYEVRWWYSSMESTRKSTMYHNNAEHHDRKEAGYWMYLENVVPGKRYNVTVRAYAKDSLVTNAVMETGAHYQDSIPITVRAYDLPPVLELLRVESRRIHLAWMSPLEDPLESHEIWFQATASDESVGDESKWIKFVEDQTRPGHRYEYQLKDLRPFQWYRFRMFLTYRPSMIRWEWPKTTYLIARTEPSVPDPPNRIEIQTIDSAPDNESGTKVFKLIWDPVRANSDSPVYYQLYWWQLTTAGNDGDQRKSMPEAAKLIQIRSDPVAHALALEQPQSENSIEQSLTPVAWKLAYNGTETHWIVSGLAGGHLYHFRLFSSNRYGVNQRKFAQTPEPLWIPDDAGVFPAFLLSHRNESHTFIVVFIIFCILAICLVGFSLFSLRFYKIRTKELDSNGSIISNHHHHQIELIPWQERPHPHLPNTLYVNSHAESIDLSDIEIFDYRSITLVKLLGKGAFGEVHEAILHKTEQRVAVKVLNKNSSKDEDYTNFLKEAKFMAKFKHPNMVQMLGVCLNHQSSAIVIVLELMEAGDLLKYLRSNRPHSKHPPTSPPLTIDDLLSICIDVAKGCEYLEQKQFVHRDLAARNCLVTIPDGGRRVVKIADFGLTRGLYQQNYYRKEGGLMPVRWMSPESLSDGVFTTQSDVWSFSVIMYEVMTLGQQPYQAYSNKEVLEYVKYGGILEQPPLCPYQIYALMKRCWNFDKDLRPSFKEILGTLERIQQDFRDEINRRSSRLTTVHNQNYLEQRPTSKTWQQRPASSGYSTISTGPSCHTAITTLTTTDGADDEQPLSCRILSMSPTMVLDPLLSANHSRSSSGSGLGGAPFVSHPYCNYRTQPRPISGGSGSVHYLNADAKGAPRPVPRSTILSTFTGPEFLDRDGYQLPNNLV